MGWSEFHGDKTCLHCFQHGSHGHSDMILPLRLALCYRIWLHQCFYRCMCYAIDDLNVLPCSYIWYLVSYLDEVAVYHLHLLYHSILWPRLEPSIIGFLSAPPRESENILPKVSRCPWFSLGIFVVARGYVDIVRYRCEPLASDGLCSFVDVDCVDRQFDILRSKCHTHVLPSHWVPRVLRSCPFSVTAFLAR